MGKGEFSTSMLVGQVLGFTPTDLAKKREVNRTTQAWQRAMDEERGKLFEIVIQSGAILAVIWEYRGRILAVIKGLPGDPSARRFVLNLGIAFLPLALRCRTSSSGLGRV